MEVGNWRLQSTLRRSVQVTKCRKATLPGLRLGFEGSLNLVKRRGGFLQIGQQLDAIG